MEALAVKNVTILDHPLIKENIGILRDVKTDCEKFNSALKRIAFALFFESTKNLPTQTVEIQTPIEKCTNEVLKKDINIIVSPILRAGLVFSDIAKEILPSCHIHHLGMFRNEETLEPVWYYNKFKGKIQNKENTFVFILDPMLATGNSGLAAIDNYIEQGIKQENIVFMCLISAPVGIEKITNKYKNIKIITAQLDVTLNSKGYIVPGLGDAGDRIFNTL